MAMLYRRNWNIRVALVGSIVELCAYIRVFSSTVTDSTRVLTIGILITID